jgi:hypothetical protein
MSYIEPLFRGDKKHPINCTGDCCVGDRVKFEKAVFVGTYPNQKFSHFELVEGEIIKDSYGKNKQQHTFTIKSKGKKVLIKGRNLYKNGVYRQLWQNEDDRKIALEEKHERGQTARACRDKRIEEKINLASAGMF